MEKVVATIFTEAAGYTVRISTTYSREDTLLVVLEFLRDEIVRESIYLNDAQGETLETALRAGRRHAERTRQRREALGVTP